MNRNVLRLPPSTISGDVREYLLDVWKAVNAIPTVSFFSGVHPNTSGITGLAGHVVINVNPASNVSRMFIKYGSATNPDRTSWQTVA